MREVLSNVEFVVALHNGNADGVVVLVKNVCAMAGRLHQRRVGRVDVRRGRYVFRYRVEAHSGCSDPLLKDRLAGKLMRKVTVLRQKFGMRQRSLRQPVTPLQFAQLRFFALAVDQVKKLLLALGRASLSGDRDKKREASNRDDGPVHVQDTLYVRSCRCRCRVRARGKTRLSSLPGGGPSRAPALLRFRRRPRAAEN